MDVASAFTGQPDGHTERCRQCSLSLCGNHDRLAFWYFLTRCIIGLLVMLEANPKGVKEEMMKLGSRRIAVRGRVVKRLTQ